MGKEIVVYFLELSGEASGLPSSPGVPVLYYNRNEHCGWTVEYGDGIMKHY